MMRPQPQTKTLFTIDRQKNTCNNVRDLEVMDTCISGSIASPNEKAMVPRALKALKNLETELPCKL